MAETFPSINPYEVLGVDCETSREEIREAYQKLVLAHHPDKITATDFTEDIQNRFNDIQCAWKILGSHENRMLYDHDRNKREKEEQLLYERAPKAKLEEFQLVDGVYTKLCRCGDNYEVQISVL